MAEPRLTAPQLREEVGATMISNRTVQRRLNEANLYGRKPAKKPYLKPAHAKARLEFAKEHEGWTVNDWKQILWCDESKINMVCGDGMSYVRRPKNKRFDPKYTKGTVKFGGGNIKIWGAFSWYGVSPLYLINGNMDQTQYREILENQMLPHATQNMPLGWKMQHDNDPKHTSKSVKKWLTDNGVRVLKWPAMSPDISPLENLWCEVKKRLAGQRFSEQNSLFNALCHAWESLPKKMLEKLVESMPRRIKALKESRGYGTKY